MYNIKGDNNEYILDDDPTDAQVKEVFREIKNRLK